MEIVEERHFDRSSVYADEIIASIPKNKIFDTVLRLIEKTYYGNFENIRYLVWSAIK